MGMSTAISANGLTIAQAARSLGVSTRTIRRFIKSGKLAAALVPGPFGEEYRIYDLPADLHKEKPAEDTPVQTAVQTSKQAPGQTSDQLINMLRELQEKNMTLAAQLGATTERIRFLENQVKLLTAATERRPWWQRLFSRKS